VVVFDIAGAIGTSISIDENTRNHSFGHYARILIDVNMAGILSDSLWVEREKFAFDIEIEYEMLLIFVSLVILVAIHRIIAKRIDPPRKTKIVFVPKRHENIVCSKTMGI
jgi:hypothetical protein